MPPEVGVTVPAEFESALDRALIDWQREQNSARLWAGDASLWTGAGEEHWLGWLGLAEHGLGQLDLLSTISPTMLGGAMEIDDVVVLGMGGSSLCPDVLPGELWTRRGRAGASRPGLDRPGSDPVTRGSDRPRPNAVYRVEQVGNDSRINYVDGVLL